MRANAAGTASCEVADGNTGEVTDGNTGEVANGNAGEVADGNAGEVADGNSDEVPDENAGDLKDLRLGPAGTFFGDVTNGAWCLRDWAICSSAFSRLRVAGFCKCWVSNIPFFIGLKGKLGTIFSPLGENVAETSFCDVVGGARYPSDWAIFPSTFSRRGTTRFCKCWVSNDSFFIGPDRGKWVVKSSDFCRTSLSRADLRANVAGTSFRDVAGGGTSTRD